MDNENNNTRDDLVVRGSVMLLIEKEIKSLHTENVARKALELLLEKVSAMEDFDTTLSTQSDYNEYLKSFSLS